MKPLTARVPMPVRICIPPGCILSYCMVPSKRSGTLKGINLFTQLMNTVKTNVSRKSGPDQTGGQAGGQTDGQTSSLDQQLTTRDDVQKRNKKIRK